MRKAEKLLAMSSKRGIGKIATILLRVLFSCDIPSSVKYGKNLQLVHNGLGVVMHRKTVIGDNCKIYQNVTLGGNGKIIDGKTQKGAPVLEDNVAVFCGAVVLGPITIGHDSYIAANCVCTKDVPPNSLVYGNPQKIVEKTFEIDFGDGH